METSEPNPSLDRRALILEEARAIKKHPNFHRAFEYYAEMYTDVFENNFFLNKVASEDARYFITFELLNLHLNRDPNDCSSGATLSRLQEFAARHYLAGSNRVLAHVSLMKHVAYIVETRNPLDRRVKRLEPTPVLLAILQSEFNNYLRILEMISDANYRLHSMTDGEFIGRVIMHGLNIYFQNCDLMKDMPAMRLFTGKNGGYEILLKLLITKPTAFNGNSKIVSFPYATAADAFKVSRAHVRRLMVEAQDTGFVRLLKDGGKQLEILPALTDMVREYISVKFAIDKFAAAMAIHSRSTRFIPNAAEETVCSPAFMA